MAECIHEDSIQMLKKEIYGNGEKGLAKSVAILSDNVKDLKKTTEDLRTSVSGLHKFMDETTGYKKHIDRTAPWIAILIAGLALSFTIYQNVRVNKLQEEQIYTEWKMNFKVDKEAKDISPITRGGTDSDKIQPDIKK
jgi:hypothetical protein